jgi:hypothetical protein
MRGVTGLKTTESKEKEEKLACEKNHARTKRERAGRDGRDEKQTCQEGKHRTVDSTTAAEVSVFGDARLGTSLPAARHFRRVCPRVA